MAMEQQNEKSASEVSEDTRSAIWRHYYKEVDDEPKLATKRKLRRVTKKEIIVRTLKNQKAGEGIMSLQELSDITGLRPHDLSGHLTHLVNEGKVMRRGRGLFAISSSASAPHERRSELERLVRSVAGKKGADAPAEEKLIIRDQDHSESKRMMLDFLNDALLSCNDVELVIKCNKDDKGKSGKITIELKAR